jgi:hypothetical protein
MPHSVSVLLLFCVSDAGSDLFFLLSVLPNIRDGLLIHTGNWTTDAQAWNPTMDMPNSSGCIHAHPEDVHAIYEILVKLGVKVNDNTFSGKNYPYPPQGIAVIQLIDA